MHGACQELLAQYDDASAVPLFRLRRLRQKAPAMPRFTLLCAAVAMIHASAHATEIQCDDQEENLQTYLEMTDILFNQRQVERAADFYADAFITHNIDEGGLVEKVRTPDYMAGIWTRIKTTNPDRKVHNDLIVCKGDFVIARATATGTLIPSVLRDKPEEGRRYVYSAIDIYRFKDGKVVERWGNNDKVAQIRQTGIAVDLSLKPLPSDDD